MLSSYRHTALVECLAQRAGPIAASEHFALFRMAPPNSPDGRAADGDLVIVHHFSPDQIDNNIGFYVAEELLPLLRAARYGPYADHAANDPFSDDEHQTFERCVGAIVHSVDPSERRAWHRFYANSLAALEQAMARPVSTPDFIWPFGAIYRQLCHLVRGQTLLDAGTCFGFLPLLLGRQANPPTGSLPALLPAPLVKIVGCDLDAALVNLASAYAAHERLDQVAFVIADILADEVEQIGTFDTVTAIHVIEHLTSQQTMPALANLWRLTAQRLIISVPLEATPDPRYGHQQVFDQERLLALGQELGGQTRYFELHGGWLIVDRF